MLAVLCAAPAALGQTAAPPGKPPLAFEERHVAIVGVDLYDGTGVAVQKDMTVVVRDGRIAAVGPAASTAVPEGARRIEGRGQTLTPGLVLMHEHLFYPVSYSPRGFSYTNISPSLEAFPALYLAGGATTIRTAGSTTPFGDLNVRDAIRAGTLPGPDIDATAPYVNGPQMMFMQMANAKNLRDIERAVDFWSAQGMTSYKAYMSIQREQLAALVQEAHKRGAKVTAHLCATTYEEAALAGIDNLEHGFLAATDFVDDKKRDQCPDFAVATKSLMAVTPETPRFQRLVKLLVDRRVALTSTPAVLEWFGGMLGAGGAPLEGLEMLAPELRAELTRNLLASLPAPTATHESQAGLLRQVLRLERAFFEAGGELMVGTDPTGGGQALPGYGGLRALRLMTKAGFRVEDVVRFASLNGARYLGRAEEIGSIAPGKRADLVLFSRGLDDGDGFAMRHVAWVMKAGIAYDSARLIEPFKGKVGLR